MMRTTILSCLLAIAAAAASGDDAPHFGVDAARTRAPGAESLASPAAWGSPLALGDEFVASPTAADGILVLAALDGTLRACREADRSALWTAELGVPVIATPAVHRGRVYVACLDGSLRVRRLADGADLGSLVTGGADLAPPLVEGGRLYLAAGFPETKLAVYDLASGAEAASVPLENVTQAAVALAPGRVLAACNSGRLASFDPETLAEQWSLSLGGNVASAAPAVSGGDVFVLAEHVLHRVSLTGVAGGALTLVDPAPPAGVFSVERAGSSLSIQGGRVAGVVRFTYAFDANVDGYADENRLVRELAFAADASTLALDWSVVLGYLSVPTFNDLPPFRLVPSPAGLGSSFAVASGVSSLLQVLDAATGTSLFSADLGGRSAASPTFANGRLQVVTRGGDWSVFQGSNAPPGAVSGLSPDGVDAQTSPVPLSWNASAEAGVTYLVRVDDDGELLEDWLFETSVSSPAAATPPLATGRLYVWSVRVRDADGAWGPWSPVARFGQDVPPEPPGPLGAEPRHGRVRLSWSASPSNDVVGYRLRVGPPGGPAGLPIELGAVLETEADGLANGTPYEFTLVAVDVAGNESAPVSATATPASAITIAGTPFDTLAAALAAAQPGETLSLGAEVFRVSAPLVVPPGVELRGVDARLTRLEAGGDFTVLEARAGAVVRRLAILAGRTGVFVPLGPVTLVNLVLKGHSGAAVEVAGEASVVNCTIVDNGGPGVSSSGIAAVRNSIVQGNAAGLQGSVVSTYNTVTDGYVGTAPGAGDASDPVEFLDAAAGDYRERERSKAVDTGDPADPFGLEPLDHGHRVNQGAFGGTESAARTFPTVVAPASSGDDASLGVCGASVGPSGSSWAALAAMVFLGAFRRRR